MDHGGRISEILAEAYRQYCCVNHNADPVMKEKVIQLGFSLGEPSGSLESRLYIFQRCPKLFDSIIITIVSRGNNSNI